MRSTENDPGTFDTFKNMLVNSVETIFAQSFSVSVHSSEEVTSFDKSLTYTSILSSIAFHGRVVGTVVIIVEKKLAGFLLEKMGLGMLSPEEEIEYIQDSVGELLNTILGKTTNKLLDRDISINIEPPEMFSFKNRNLSVFVEHTWIYGLNTDEGRCYLIVKNISD